MNTKNSINESLEVIRRALEDEKNDSNKDTSSNILILNQKVNSDGTIKLLQKNEEINSEIKSRYIKIRYVNTVGGSGCQFIEIGALGFGSFLEN